MILFTEEELGDLAEIVLKKIDRDKRFDQYTDGQIVTILGAAIMRVGINVAEAVYQEADNDEGMAS